MVSGKVLTVYGAVSIVLRGQYLLFKLRCLSFRDVKHATSPRPCMYTTVGEPDHRREMVKRNEEGQKAIREINRLPEAVLSSRDINRTRGS